MLWFGQLRPIFLRRERGRIDGFKEGRGLGGIKAALAFIGNGLIAPIRGSLDRRPFDLAGLPGNGRALLGGVAFRDRLGSYFVQPHIR